MTSVMLGLAVDIIDGVLDGVAFRTVFLVERNVMHRYVSS